MRQGYIIRILFLFLLVLLLLPTIYLLTLPDISSLKRKNPPKTALMKFREKEREREGKKYQIHQAWVPLSRVSPYLIKAVLIAEDDKFWKHEGFDFQSMERALEKDLERGKFKYGGSTISQQLAKNLYLSPVKSIPRKFHEAVLTWKMERTLPKRRILELYLNVAEWGEGVFGAEAAARHYYGKPCLDLTPVEAARLAVVLPNPRKYNPTGDQRYVVNRSRMIYRIMVRRGIVDKEYEE